MSSVKIAEVNRFIVECLRAVGVNEKASHLQAKLLLEADKIGHPSHGLNRLDMYIKDIVRGLCKPNNEPCIIKQTASTALVDGNNVLGCTASNYAMDVAIKKAKETGVGWVTVKGSNHNGMMGWWAKKAASQGLIGIACTNTSPLMAPTRSKQPALGTNPIAVVATASNGELFYLDMATTSVSVGKLEMLRRKNEKIPSGWAQAVDGYETNDPDTAIETGCLMPLGGPEETSGYKGFGLAAMVELFCGISSGSNYSTKIRSWTEKNPKDPANLGHCMMAINPECFMPGFGDRLTDCLKIWRNLEPVDPRLPVLVPGDKERAAWCATEELGTVSIVEQMIQSYALLAKQLKVKPMQVEGQLDYETKEEDPLSTTDRLSTTDPVSTTDRLSTTDPVSTNPFKPTKEKK